MSDAVSILELLKGNQTFALVADIDGGVFVAEADDRSVNDFAFTNFLLALRGFEQLRKAFFAIVLVALSFFITHVGGELVHPVLVLQGRLLGSLRFLFHYHCVYWPFLHLTLRQA